MKRLLWVTGMVAAIAIGGSPAADAGHPLNYGFFPFGFYQPYGAQYGTTLRTPPHFAVNPPVYYGARYARPYGLSPFASPPLVGAPAGFDGRLRSKFEEGRNLHLTPATGKNPHVSHAPSAAPGVKGEVRYNPYVDGDDDRLADRR